MSIETKRTVNEDQSPISAIDGQMPEAAQEEVQDPAARKAEDKLRALLSEAEVPQQSFWSRIKQAVVQWFSNVIKFFSSSAKPRILITPSTPHLDVTDVNKDAAASPRSSSERTGDEEFYIDNDPENQEEEGFSADKFAVIEDAERRAEETRRNEGENPSAKKGG